MTGHRFYGELARWWPLVSPPEEYVEEAAEAARLLSAADRPVREVLELGSGGGSNAVHLRERFRMTLTDLSPEMLEVSRALNPDCEHVAGDMRELRLNRDFDAVLVHDAVDYMTTEADLRAAVATAFEHCRPGGLALFMPDQVTETFEPSSDAGGTDGDDGRGVRFLDWSWDPGDGTIRTEYAFVLREPDGSVRSVHETHVTGLFPRATWLAILTGAGFAAEAVTERTTEDREPRVLFVGRRR